MPKKSLPPMSPAETEILALVWKLEKATVLEICDVLPPNRDIQYATVQTLCRRLEKKGYLKHELKGQAHAFFAAVKKEDVVKRSVGDFVNRLFGGDPAPLLVHLAEEGKVTAKDIERLRNLTKPEKKI